jgi:hypothetical protein
MPGDASDNISDDDDGVGEFNQFMLEKASTLGILRVT